MGIYAGTKTTDKIVLQVKLGRTAAALETHTP